MPRHSLGKKTLSLQANLTNSILTSPEYQLRKHLRALHNEVSGMDGEVAGTRDGSPKPNQRKPSARRTKKSGILRGLDTAKIIPISDNGGDDLHKPASNNHHHATRTRIYGRSDALYDMGYHPMDEVTRPKRAAKRRRRSHSGGFNSDEDEELDLPSDSGSDIGARRRLNKRRHSDGARRSARTAAHKYVDYSAKRHPQDEGLAVAGVIRRRKRSFVKYDSGSDEEATPKVETKTRDTADPEDSDADERPSPSDDFHPYPPSIARSEPQEEEKPPTRRYAEGWSVYNTRSGEVYFAHYKDSLYPYSIDTSSDDSGHRSLGNSEIDRELAQLAGITEEDYGDLMQHVDELIGEEERCDKQTPNKNRTLTAPHSQRTLGEPSLDEPPPEFQPPPLPFESSSESLSRGPEVSRVPSEQSQLQSSQSKPMRSKRGTEFCIYEDADDMQHLRSPQPQPMAMLADDFPKENVQSGSNEEQPRSRVQSQEGQRPLEREMEDMQGDVEPSADVRINAQVGSEPPVSTELFHVPVESAGISPTKVLEVPNLGLKASESMTKIARHPESSIGDDTGPKAHTGQNEHASASEHTPFQTVVMSSSTMAGPLPFSHTIRPTGFTGSTPTSPSEVALPATSPPPSTASTTTRFPSHIPSSPDRQESQLVVDNAQVEAAGNHTTIFGPGDDALRKYANVEGGDFAEAMACKTHV